MISCSETIYADNLDHICSGTLDVGPHLIQELRHINNMRFLRCILNDGHAFGSGCCQHNIDGCTHTDHVKINMLAV